VQTAVSVLWNFVELLMSSISDRREKCCVALDVVRINFPDSFRLLTDLIIPCGLVFLCSLVCPVDVLERLSFGAAQFRVKDDWKGQF
jgi:ferredoxin